MTGTSWHIEEKQRVDEMVVRLFDPMTSEEKTSVGRKAFEKLIWEKTVSYWMLKRIPWIVLGAILYGILGWSSGVCR
jgi:hypothetical protein